MIRTKEYNIGSWLKFSHIFISEDTGRVYFNFDEVMVNEILVDIRRKMFEFATRTR